MPVRGRAGGSSDGRVSPVAWSASMQQYRQSEVLPARKTLETSMLREAERHAERIMAMVQSGAHESGDAITRSWSRCLNEYRLHPDRPREPAIIEGAVLEARRERRADVIDCARYEMTTLYQQLADADSAVILT